MTAPTDDGRRTRRFRLAALTSTTTTILTVVIVLALAVVTTVVLLSTPTTTAVALFPRAASIYEGDDVRILGVKVGRIDHIDPTPQNVRVEFSWDSSYKVPADARAVIVSPTLVSTRFLQLDPVYTGGPTLQSGAVIPETRTSAPMEFDDLKDQLGSLSQALGPHGANQDGSLSRFLNVAAANVDGQGDRFKNTLQQLAAATDTLSRGRKDLFGTVDNLQVFVSALAASDQQVAEVNQRLASVTGTLSSSRGDLDNALVELDKLAPLAQQFFDQNRGRISETVDRAGQVTRTFAGVRDDLALALLVAGPGIQNILNLYNNQTNAYTGMLAVPQVHNPSQLICGGIAAVAPDNQTAGTTCATVLGPLLDAVTLPGLPVGVSPLGGTTTSRPLAPAPVAPPGTGSASAAGLAPLLPGLSGGNR